MEQKHQEEFINLRTEAQEILRRGFQEKPRDRRVFQLVVLSSFEASYSWELYERKIEAGAVEMAVIHAIWHSQKDVEKFDPFTRLRHPQKLSPTITTNIWSIGRSIALEIIEELSKIAVPVLPYEGGINLDGISYELTLGSDSNLSRFVWHNQGPSQWNDLQNWAMQMVAKLDAASPS